ncbi:helix-turn-helix domain-containing protein [Streptomyces sp. NBC_00101]|uniref:hypothetical protein n=1 Tax=Streptomyces sp. NBC_00101 TaxID=2975651 RepID=UPI0032447B07
MAKAEFIAPSGARSGAPHPVSGVTHVRTRLTAEFTILHNALAQLRGSAAAVGVGAYIQSLPDGAPVTVEALCAHFDEGRTTIARALRELEQAGYLVRRKERWSGGRIRTRTFFRTVPGLLLPEVPGPEPEPVSAPETQDPEASEASAPEAHGTDVPSPDVTPSPESAARESPSPAVPTQRRPLPSPIAADAEGPADAAKTEDGTEDEADEHQGDEHESDEHRGDEREGDEHAPLGIAGVDPQAVVILASLRIVDPRLVLNRGEVRTLAPAVAKWLAGGIDAAQITETLTVGLPSPFRSRPANILAYRLRETPVALPPRPTPSPQESDERAADGSPAGGAPLSPWQTCDGCERAFRACAPGPCRECAREAAPAPAPTAEAATGSIASMRSALSDSRAARAAAPVKRPRFSARPQPRTAGAAPA